MRFWRNQSDTTVIGRFSSKLVPIGEIEVLKQDGTFESLDFLIDTGFEEQVGVRRGLDVERKLRQDPGIRCDFDLRNNPGNGREHARGAVQDGNQMAGPAASSQRLASSSSFPLGPDGDADVRRLSSYFRRGRRR